MDGWMVDGMDGWDGWMGGMEGMVDGMDGCRDGMDFKQHSQKCQSLFEFQVRKGHARGLTSYLTSQRVGRFVKISMSGRRRVP